MHQKTTKQVKLNKTRRHTRLSNRSHSASSKPHHSSHQRRKFSSKAVSFPPHAFDAPDDLPLGDSAFMAKSLYGSQPEMTYGGALSFLRRKYTRDVFGHGENGNERADVIVSGVPFDCATTYRTGARLGPRAIRQASVQLAELEPYPWSFNPFNHLGVIDAGDIFIDPHYPRTVCPTIASSALNFISSATPKQHTTTAAAAATETTENNIFDYDAASQTYGQFLTDNPQRPPRLLTFGGDHFITYPLLQAHAKKYGQLSLLHFDAHCDTWEPTNHNEHDINHGTMFFHAAQEGIVDPKSSLQVGLRTINHHPIGKEYNQLDAMWVHEHGPKAVVDKIIETFSKHQRPVYLTFDIDCLDPAYAPGTGTPVPGGLTSAQVFAILRNIPPEIDIVGADIVEVAPAYDNAEITGLMAAHIGMDILCRWANQKRQHGITYTA